MLKTIVENINDALFERYEDSVFNDKECPVLSRMAFYATKGAELLIPVALIIATVKIFVPLFI